MSTQTFMQLWPLWKHQPPLFLPGKEHRSLLLPNLVNYVGFPLLPPSAYTSLTPQSNSYVGKQGLCSKTHHSIKFTSFIHSLSTLPSLLLQACPGMEDTPVNKADQVPAQWGSQPRDKDTIKQAKYTQNDLRDE